MLQIASMCRSCILQLQKANKFLHVLANGMRRVKSFQCRHAGASGLQKNWSARFAAARCDIPSQNAVIQDTMINISGKEPMLPQQRQQLKD